MALHVSNLNLDLSPLVFRLARATGLDGVEILNQRLPSMGTSRSKWVVLHRVPAAIQSFVRFTEQRRERNGLDRASVSLRSFGPNHLANVPLWTDDYSDLFGVLMPISARWGGSGGIPNSAGRGAKGDPE